MVGAEKSLLTILSMLDTDKYDVDLFLFRHQGEFMEYLPKSINLLKESENYKIFSENRKLAPLKFFMKLDFKRGCHSFIYLMKCLYYKIVGKLYIGWEHVQTMFDDVEKQYDASIAFLERKTIYFNVDKVKAQRKIGFIHNDYKKYQFDKKSDRKYFKSYDKIATVSKHCKIVLDEIFPEYKGKFLVIKNMISKQMLQQMAGEILNVKKTEKVMIVTVGRLVHQKGIDRAVKICKKLRDNGYDVKWYIIGSGSEEGNLRKQIVQNNLQDYFILVGPQKNPYKWMRACDIYVQPSRFEGFGITVCEAKVLVKPMVVSDIPEFREQILDGINGYVAENNKMMYNRIVELIENKDGVRERFIKGLEQDKLENRKELEKLYEIING